jgi:hypothetical protein
MESRRRDGMMVDRDREVWDKKLLEQGGVGGKSEFGEIAKIL